MGCTRLCKEIDFANGSYKDGVKYCSNCEIFLITQDISYPCCNRRLRYTAHKKLFGEHGDAIFLSRH